MSNNVIKFTDDELNEIKSLQDSYEKSLVFFGQLSLERMSIEESIKNLNEVEQKAKIDYLELQKKESTLLDKLSSKYGEGSLNIKDGTFIPNK